jgi:hypothetical protein
MKNTELRIGNYVEVYGKVETIVDVMCDCVNTLNIEGAHYGLVNPIPLTEEWLEKFGFEERRYKKQGVLRSYIKKGNSMHMTNSGNIVYGFKSKMLFGVHELQNLYFALTGEELKIKKP